MGGVGEIKILLHVASLCSGNQPDGPLLTAMCQTWYPIPKLAIILSKSSFSDKCLFSCISVQCSS